MKGPRAHKGELGLPGRLSAMFGLLWLTAPLASLLEDDVSVLHKAAVIAAVAAVVAYVAWKIFEDEGEDDPPPTIAEVLRASAFVATVDIGLSLLDRPDWGWVLSYFVVAFLAIGLPGWRGLVAVFSWSATALGVFALAGSGAGTSLGQAAGVLGIGVVLCGVGEIIRANRELQCARAELARVAVEEERRRFARDLHDLLGHSLSMIAIKARLAQRVQHSDPARATQELIDIETAARRSLAEVRETVSGYRRATIATELVGVRAALESAGVALDTRVTRMSLDAEDEAVLAWALREAATNVVRHAGARNVVVRLEPAGEGARLEVEDDGQGPVSGHGNGLTGLAERVAEREGRLETGGGAGGGFRLAVELPGTITM